jgi:hypothetical protein
MSEDACGLILLDTPVPVDPSTINARSYSYIDGEALMTAVGDRPVAAPRIGADMAEAGAFSWRLFGMAYSDRIDHGLCAGARAVEEAVERVTSLQWRSQDAYVTWARRVRDYVDALRVQRGDVELHDVIVAAGQVLDAGRIEDVGAYGLTGAGLALSCCWRLVDAARRCGVVDVVRMAAGRLIPALGAAADAPYALRYRPPAAQVYPDIIDWVGQTHYPTAEEFVAEADRLGISRRLHGIPKAVVTPWTRSFLAHADVDLGNGRRGPAVFGYYRAAQLQYIVGDTGAVPPWIEAYGVQAVAVQRVERQPELLPG